MRSAVVARPPDAVIEVLAGLFAAGRLSVLILDDGLRIIGQHGPLTTGLPVGQAVDEVLPYMAGIAPDLLNLQDEPDQVFLLGNVGLMGASSSQKLNVEAFWLADQGVYCLLLHRLGLRTEPETEIAKQIKSRRIAEEHLQQTRRDLAAQRTLTEGLASSAPCAMAIIGSDGLYRFATGLWRDMFQIGPDAIEGRAFATARATRQVLPEARFQQVLAGMTIEDQQATLPSPTGTLREVIWSARPWRPSRNIVDGVAVTARDVSELETERDALRRQVDRLEARNQALEDFVATAAHDLEAPCRAITRAAANAPAGLGDEIAGHAERLRGLLRDLLEHARSAASMPVIERVHIARAARQALSETERGEDFTLVCRPAEAAVTADRVAMETILRNLITNAVRHHDSDRGQIEIDVSEANISWVVAITDDGPGMPGEDQSRLFEPFYRPENSKGRPGHGLGLGLVRAAARRLGGSIRAGSRSDGRRGAVFTLEWPKVAPDRALDDP
ncbi:MAG: HAMP domain-containing sensor histidine kinase [Hyphomicrobiaceae bacterium]